MENLTTEERIFVAYDYGSRYMHSTTNENWRTETWGVTSVCLWDDSFEAPRPGTRIRITWFRNGIPVKIETKTKTSWREIYKLDERHPLLLSAMER